jgi:hypothetical protein
MNAPAELATVIASQPHATLGYKTFTLGSFTFRRDEYFAHIGWTTRDGRPLSHTMDVGNYLRALMRDVAWGFFYGWVNFDNVLGTVNKYTSVDLYAGSYNATMKEAGVDLLENFPTEQIRATFEQMLDDWTNETFDPFAAPQETGSPYGRKNGSNTAKLTRARELAKRCVGMKDDLPMRTDARGRADQPRVRRRAAGRARAAPRAGLRGRGPRLQPVRVPVALAGDRGTRASRRSSSTASCARRPKSTCCRSSTATTGSSGSSRCATRSTGTAPTRTPASRSPA